MDLLFQKVNEYLHNSRSLAAGQKKINWIEIGKALQRNHIQCKTRYEREKCEPLGTFTPEEDALIMLINFFCCSVGCVESSNSDTPIRPLSGVRISWLILAKNSLLA